MAYLFPANIMEWIQESYDEEYDYDPTTEISDSLSTLLKWAGSQLLAVPIDAINTVIVYYREDTYKDWSKSGRPRDLTTALVALEYHASIIDRELSDTHSPNLYYPNTLPPDFPPPATVREYLALRAAQLGSTPNYESEVLETGIQYTAVRIIGRRGPLYWCFDKASCTYGSEI